MFHGIRLAARSLARQPAATTLQLATIAAGVGGLAAVLAVVLAVAVRGLPFDEPQRLVSIEVTSSRGFSISNSMPNYRDWRDRNRTLAAVAGHAGWNFRLVHDDRSEVLDGAAVVGDLLGVLRVQPALGRAFTASETDPGSPPLVLLSHSLWQRAYGAEPGVIGSTMNLGGTPHTIIGVLPAGFAFPRTEPAVMVNMGSIAGLPWNDRNSSFGTRMYGRLRDGVTLAAAGADIERVGAEVKAEYGPLTALPSVLSLSDDLLADRDRQLYILLGAVAIVMLIAMANAGGLMLARAADRRRDAAVRMALGGTRSDLRHQFVLENGLLALAGGACGLVLAVLLLRLLVPMLPDDLPQSLLSRIAIDLPTTLMVLAGCLAGGALFGLLAVRQAAPPGLLDAIRGGTASIVAPRTRARSALLVGEVALSVVLAIGSGLLLTSFYKLRTIDKGFEDGGVLMGRVTPTPGVNPTREQWVAYYDRLISQAAAIPGVSSAAASLTLPLTRRSWELRIQPFGATEAIESGPSVQYNMVSNDFFTALSVPFVSGRAFSDQDRDGSQPVAIIDESMARQFWPGQDPIGQRITIGELGADSALAYRTVVGVVSNVRHYTLREPARIQVYVPIQQSLNRWGNALTLIVKGNVPPGTLMTPMREAVQANDPGASLWSVFPLAHFVNESISVERTLGVITIWLAGVAALVTAVGLFALVTYTVSQRRREVALRLALGATPASVVGLITWSGTSMALLGVAIGAVGAAAASRVLTSVLFGVTALDPMVYLACGLTIVMVTVIASLAPALAARRMAPSAVLRED